MHESLDSEITRPGGGWTAVGAAIGGVAAEQAKTVAAVSKTISNLAKFVSKFHLGKR